LSDFSDALASAETIVSSTAMAMDTVASNSLQAVDGVLESTLERIDPGGIANVASESEKEKLGQFLNRRSDSYSRRRRQHSCCGATPAQSHQCRRPRVV
jgi:hypothetical protein